MPFAHCQHRSFVSIEAEFNALLHSMKWSDNENNAVMCFRSGQLLPFGFESLVMKS